MVIPSLGTNVTFVKKLPLANNFCNFPSIVAILPIKFLPVMVRISFLPWFFTVALIGSLICGLGIILLPTLISLDGVIFSSIVASESFLFIIETRALP